MLIEELLNYYKNNVTTYSLVFRYMRITYTISTGLLVFLIFFAYLSLLVMPTVLINYYILLYTFIGFITILFSSIIALFINNKKAQRILYNHYKIEAASGIWRTEDFNNMQSQILINYLKRKNLYTAEKLKLLVKLLDKEIERSKSPSFLATGAFLALFAPIWLQYIITIFKKIEKWEFSDVSLFVLISISSIIFIAVCIGTFKRVLHIAQEFFMIEVNIKKNFILHVENILLRFSEEEQNEISFSLQRSRKDKVY
ncbi:MULTISPECIES: hypothetical protein [Paenibacillus]|uniref:DUF4231 domain-containing protein n=2 Tax=Paenibacillus TaxID=44249 RepID=A0ABX2Z548_PAEPO|nr:MULTISPECIES: hypothetical protein [Paenibacillus]MDR6777161.1 hypothetical protein [Paenibacillus peoriae]ODA06332.1 hypothetical protein A7312_15650 [Paenibacillus polymyxa]OME71625.1 hypothetical protein BK119_08330 [Paenibacillus peoriae]POR27187.1 hypothetical protein CG775_15030 [Paenibacillus polymyxa]